MRCSDCIHFRPSRTVIGIALCKRTRHPVDTKGCFGCNVGEPIKLPGVVEQGEPS